MFLPSFSWTQTYMHVCNRPQRSDLFVNMTVKYPKFIAIGAKALFNDGFIFTWLSTVLCVSAEICLLIGEQSSTQNWNGALSIEFSIKSSAIRIHMESPVKYLIHWCAKLRDRLIPWIYLIFWFTWHKTYACYSVQIAFKTCARTCSHNLRYLIIIGSHLIATINTFAVALRI